MNKYIQTDELQKLIDWENIMRMKRYAGGHDDQMKGLIRNSKVIAHWNEGDWQGMVATCVQLEDGRFAIYNDYYGSCSGCDSWEGANDAEVRILCINLANSAYIFNNLEDVKEFLSEEEFDNYSWNRCSKPLLKKIENFQS